MRYSTPKAAALGLLSTWFLFSSGNPVDRSVACAGAVCEDWGSASIAGPFAHGPRNLHVRAGGGGRPGRPDENTPNGSPGTHPNDPSNPSGPGDQNGEQGGFGNTEETEGGFTNTCDKRGWLSFWRRSGCGGAPPVTNNPPPPVNNPPANQPVTGPPSVRNNNNRPATVSQPFDLAGSGVTLPRIDINARKEQMRTKIAPMNAEGGPWFFFSGFTYEDTNVYKENFDFRQKKKEEKKPGYIRDAMEEMPKSEEMAYDQAHISDYYWAAMSKAFAQAVEGRVYIIIPEGSSINRPAPDRGTNWWSFEVPELTRSGNIDSITVVPAGNKMIGDSGNWEIDFGTEKVIWNRNDEPIGYPGDELYKYERPAQDWRP